MEAIDKQIDPEASLNVIMNARWVLSNLSSLSSGACFNFVMMIFSLQLVL